MNANNFAATVKQDHKGFFGGDEVDTFEKTKRSAPRREAAEQEAFKARKGKLNKTKRGNTNWEDSAYYTTAEGCQRVHAQAVENSVQRPRWEII